jgi:hypothetical protein
MAQQCEITISLRWRWWVWPLMRGAVIWYCCGLPVNPHRLADWIGRRGAVIGID